MALDNSQSITGDDPIVTAHGVVTQCKGEDAARMMIADAVAFEEWANAGGDGAPEILPAIIPAIAVAAKVATVVSTGAEIASFFMGDKSEEDPQSLEVLVSNFSTSIIAPYQFTGSDLDTATVSDPLTVLGPGESDVFLISGLYKGEDSFDIVKRFMVYGAAGDGLTNEIELEIEINYSSDDDDPTWELEITCDNADDDVDFEEEMTNEAMRFTANDPDAYPSFDLFVTRPNLSSGKMTISFFDAAT